MRLWNKRENIYTTLSLGYTGQFEFARLDWQSWWHFYYDFCREKDGPPGSYINITRETRTTTFVGFSWWTSGERSPAVCWLRDDNKFISLSLSSYLPSSSSCPEVWLTGSHIFSYFRRVALASRSIFPRFARRTLTCAHTSHAIICPAPKKRETREEEGHSLSSRTARLCRKRHSIQWPPCDAQQHPFCMDGVAQKLPTSSIPFEWKKKKNLSTVQYRSFLISRFFFPSSILRPLSSKYITRRPQSIFALKRVRGQSYESGWNQKLRRGSSIPAVCV